MVKEIKRDYYLEQLIKREGNGLIKVVTGVRRCGKSYYATARGELEKNKDSMNELEGIGENL